MNHKLKRKRERRRVRRLVIKLYDWIWWEEK